VTVYRGQGLSRDRAIAGALAAAVLVLFALLIIKMGYFDRVHTFGERFTAISLRSSSSAASSHQDTNQPVPVKPQTDPLVTPIVLPKLAIPVPKAPPVSFIPMSSADMASADISKMGKAGSGQAASNSGKVYGPGEGPEGQQLYRAEWYREPSRAELAGYLSERNASGGTADIACLTVEHYHVENCQELSESPRGSGLARALRQAAWQFLVRPPRINGKPQLGVWVRIHFEFLRAEAE
jgi:protein TonB